MYICDTQTKTNAMYQLLVYPFVIKSPLIGNKEKEGLLGFHMIKTI